MIKKLIAFFGSLHFPWVDKKFNLNHYFELEKELEKLNVPFAVGLVSTYGHGSNLLIKLVQKLTKQTRNSKVTHAFAIISNKKNNFRVAEFIGQGLQEATLLSAIGNRDVVKILVPNEKVSEQNARLFIKYVKIVLARDAFTKIKYDLDHDINDHERYDCSELIFHAINYGMGENVLRPVRRMGRDTWSPADLENTEYLKLIYDSKIGLIR